MLRLWTADNMTWIMAPHDVLPDQKIEWANKSYLVVKNGEGLRVREVKQRGENV